MTVTATTPFRDEYLRPHWPRDLYNQIVKYIKNGKTPELEFVQLLIQNDLKGAFRAAGEHRKIFSEIVQFLFSFAPATCWGSPKSYSDWIASGGLFGTNREDEREHA